MRVAVIGTGIAGNAAAWTLSKHYPVTVYDRELRPGGHSHTVSIDYEGTLLAVDIGFIVYNELNYPDLTALFAHLGVETVDSCMSSAVTADTGRFEWRGGGNNWLETAIGLFAQPRNLLSPSYLWMLRDILTFNQQSIEDYAAGKLAGLTLGEYFRTHHFAPRLLTDYLAPMGAAIWSAPASEMLDFPAENFVAFFSNHRLLQYDRPVWRTVKGGSRRYVEKLTAAFRDHIKFGCAVTSIERTSHGVIVHDSHGNSNSYDHVVIASHSDQALAMLSDADERDRYDRIASIEMIEAVGEQFWPKYFSQLRDRLLPGGLAGIQAIAIKDSLFQTYRREVDFIQRYVFPGGMLPSPETSTRSANGSGFPSSANAFSGKIMPRRLRSGEAISARPGRT
jgi:predicted NAD/FAD-binding protein